MDARPARGFLRRVYARPRNIYPVFIRRSVTCQRPPVLRAQRTTGPTPRPRAQGERYMDLVYLAVFAAMAALTGTQLRLCARLFARGRP